VRDRRIASRCDRLQHEKELRARGILTKEGPEWNNHPLVRADSGFLFRLNVNTRVVISTSLRRTMRTRMIVPGMASGLMSDAESDDSRANCYLNIHEAERWDPMG